MTDNEKPSTLEEAIARVVREEIRCLAVRDNRYLTVKETAAYLRHSHDTIYSLIHQGKLRPIKLTGKPVFDINDLDKMMEDNKAKPSP